MPATPEAIVAALRQLFARDKLFARDTSDVFVFIDPSGVVLYARAPQQALPSFAFVGSFNHDSSDRDIIAALLAATQKATTT